MLKNSSCCDLVPFKDGKPRTPQFAVERLEQPFG